MVKQRRFYSFILILFLLFGAILLQYGCSDTKENQVERSYVLSESQDRITPQVGESWGYQARSHEMESFVVLRKAEDIPDIGRMWHVSFFGLLVKNPTVPEKPHKHIMHLPIKEAPLLASLTEKLNCDVPDGDWEEGYNMWKADQGGVFDIPLQECVNAIEKIVNQ